MTDLPAEGGIDIDITVAQGRITAVNVRNRRIQGIAAALNGFDGDEVPSLIARLFAVCRTAQGLAALQAIEAAAGVSLPAPHHLARRILLLGEMILEHAGRACLDWPRLLGEAPILLGVKALRASLSTLHQAVYPDGDWLRPGGGRLLPDLGAIRERLRVVGRWLDDAVFGGALALDEAQWPAWTSDGRTPAARLAAHIANEGLAGFGASDVAALPAMPLAELGARMAEDDGEFASQPDWRGEVRQTGPLARRGGHPLVAGLLIREGNGLMAHLAARLAELALGWREMQDAVDHLCHHENMAMDRATGSGVGVVEAARGCLAHRVELREGRVARYGIVAPTEWNFHPKGALVCGLLGRPAGIDPQARANLLVAALDPCVTSRVRVA